MGLFSKLLSAVAIHEAGHVVIAHANGFHVEYVQISGETGNTRFEYPVIKEESVFPKKRMGVKKISQKKKVKDLSESQYFYGLFDPNRKGIVDVYLGGYAAESGLAYLTDVSYYKHAGDAPLTQRARMDLKELFTLLKYDESDCEQIVARLVRQQIVARFAEQQRNEESKDGWRYESDNDKEERYLQLLVEADKYRFAPAMFHRDLYKEINKIERDKGFMTRRALTKEYLTDYRLSLNDQILYEHMTRRIESMILEYFPYKTTSIYERQCVVIAKQLMKKRRLSGENIDNIMQKV
jgi:hypothetical protein